MRGFLRRLTGHIPPAPRSKNRRPVLSLEPLEDRTTPTVVSPNVIAASFGSLRPAGAPGQPAGFSPGQVRQAYGFNQIAFLNGAVPGDGAGQVIAIVDAYDQPNIAADLAIFDATYGLSAPPSFTTVNQAGGAALPAADAQWGLEISLDVEWAHAIAPGAGIMLVETNSANGSDLLAGENFARNQPGVSVVSMSWAGGEFTGESYYDSYFTTPAGHTGVTFVAASGDTGSAGAPDWPSVSPNVLAVGGTQLSLGAAGAYLGETAWSGSSGGLSVGEAQPAYQRGVVTQSATQRAVPDVAYDASPATPFAVRDTGYGGWLTVGGTSAGAPQWAALIAIADQGRAAVGEGTLDGGTQTLPLLYQLPAGDFHDVASGSNGAYSAGIGYDLVTGRGSPIANLIVAGLVGSTSSSGSSSGDASSPSLVFTTETDHSLWGENPSDGQWVELSPAGTILAISASKDASGRNEVFALASDQSLWIHSVVGWSLLSPAGTINALSASPNNVVFALASDSSLWEHSAAGWSELSPAGTIFSVSGGADSSGGAEAFAVASDHSLWQFDRHAWRLLSPGGTINSVSAVADAAFVVAADGSLWRHTAVAWTELSPAGTILSVSAGTDATGNAAAFALASDHSLWRYTAAAGWQRLSAAGAVAAITNQQGPDLFILTVDGVLWEFDGSAWSEVVL